MVMVMSKQINKKLSALKTNAIKLRNSYQLPFYLTYAITKCNYDTDVKVIVYLREQCEHMLRVKGYYHRYPKVAEQFDELIKADLNKMGFGL